jgi:hypothetical protein
VNDEVKDKRLSLHHSAFRILTSDFIPCHCDDACPVLEQEGHDSHIV